MIMLMLPSSYSIDSEYMHCMYWMVNTLRGIYDVHYSIIIYTYMQKHYFNAFCMMMIANLNFREFNFAAAYVHAGCGGVH